MNCWSFGPSFKCSAGISPKRSSFPCCRRREPNTRPKYGNRDGWRRRKVKKKHRWTQTNKQNWSYKKPDCTARLKSELISVLYDQLLQEKRDSLLSLEKDERENNHELEQKDGSRDGTHLKPRHSFSLERNFGFESNGSHQLDSQIFLISQSSLMTHAEPVRNSYLLLKQKLCVFFRKSIVILNHGSPSEEQKHFHQSFLSVYDQNPNYFLTLNTLLLEMAHFVQNASVTEVKLL